jgi:membrane peptidoglycan carboxypeptidase
MFFTKVSLNSGFWGMANELDLCKIGKTAESLGVTRANGTPIPLATKGGNSNPADNPAPYEILGSDNVSPLAMAAAYSTVANKGVFCQPKVIDKVTDADGKSLAIPKTTCTQVIDPKVAATAAFALKGPMGAGGTAVNGNPNDGTELIGKTGTHDNLQTWLITSSTKVTTANWVGNANGFGDLVYNYFNGLQLWNIRYPLARDIQGAIDQWYKGGSFPTPDTSLTKQSQKSVPNVVGMSQADAINALLNAGFGYVISSSVSSDLPAGTIAEQNPGPGKATAGTRITISPSDGKGKSSGGSNNSGNGSGGGTSPTPAPGGNGGGKNGGGNGGGGNGGGNG